MDYYLSVTKHPNFPFFDKPKPAHRCAGLRINNITQKIMKQQHWWSMMDSTLQDIVPPNSLFPLFSKDKDPQLILQDLDKGLRSQKIHEQYESLLFFAKLINKYPQAVVVNTAFMKLSDLFRVRYDHPILVPNTINIIRVFIWKLDIISNSYCSNNFIRYYILQIFQQCQQHTNKILNIDEVLKRLYSVLLSNDPDARAITLRYIERKKEKWVNKRGETRGKKKRESF